MQIQEAIEKRRSIRHYVDKKIKEEDIARILKAGTLAPSAHNKQPWFIHVVESQKTKEQIADILIQKEDESIKNTARIMKESSVLFIIFEEKTDLSVKMQHQSIGAFMENMCLEATELGIGSLWIGHILEVEKEIKELFHEKRKVACALALGYTEVNPSPRPRKNLKDMIQIHDDEEEVE